MPEANEEVVVISGVNYVVRYVSREEIYPRFGCAYLAEGLALVRVDLSPRIKRFVRAHELYHLRDKKDWGGWWGMELRANFWCATRDPLGAVVCVFASLTSPARIAFYIDRIWKRY